MYFQLLIDKLLLSKWANLAIFSLLLIPSNPSNPFPLIKESPHWLEQIDSNYNNKDASELFKIYSVLKSQRMELSDSSVWDVSTTILEESRKHSLDPLLILALINVESSFQTEAVSNQGARGLMQIRPIVANALAKELVSRDRGINGAMEEPLEPIFEPLDLDDPILNIRLGVFYLHSLKKNFRDLKLALTAYNWGPTEVRNRLEEDEGLPLDYAMKVLSSYHSYRKDSR